MSRTLILSIAIAIALCGCTPNPGYKSDTSTSWPFDYVWTPGMTHPQYQHIISADQPDHWAPDPGYRFVSENSMMVKWSPGDEHSSFKNVYADETEGKWKPGEGYAFLENGTLEAKWSVGIRHSTLEHIYTAEDEGGWKADPGYSFLEKGKLEVRWKPGTRHDNFANIYTAKDEGIWLAEPGYKFVKNGLTRNELDAEDMRVEWIPYSPHPYCNLVAAEQEGYWRAAEGYRLISDNSFSVEKIQVEKPDTRLRDTVIGIAVALIANAFVDEKPDDNFVDRTGRTFAREVRDTAAKSAITTAFSEPEADAPTTIECDYFGLDSLAETDTL